MIHPRIASRWSKLGLAVVCAAVCSPALAESSTLQEILRTKSNGFVWLEYELHRGEKPSTSNREVVKAERRLVVISKFSDGGQQATNWRADVDGRTCKWSSHFFASMSHHRRHLTPAEKEELLQRLARLERSTPKPPIDQTVVVSFQNGKTWETNVYDARRLPANVESIIAILSAINESSE